MSADEPLTTEPQAPEPQAPEAESEQSLASFLGELVVLVALAVILAVGIRTYVVQLFYIPSGSMEPTLHGATADHSGDRVVVNKFVYRFNPPQRGDIVVFVAPTEADKDFIKRVIAVGGDVIEIRDGHVIVDGKPTTETYVAGEFAGAEFGPVDVPKGKLFVIGDNRGNSSDSRVFGPIDEDKVIGEAIATYWPFNRIRLLN